jgi:hypothetical protein
LSLFLSSVLKPIMTRVVRAAILYFAIVFGVGFVLGTVRTFWVVPRLGARAAGLFEILLMFATCRCPTASFAFGESCRLESTERFPLFHCHDDWILE